MPKLSVETIENRANLVRAKLNIENVYAFDVHCVLERLKEKAKNFSFRPASSDEIGENEAVMYEETGVLAVHERVLDDAKAGRHRARFTIAHELGHFFLGHEGARRRSPEKLYGSKAQPEEIEADIFASYFLVPTKLGWDAQNPEEISDRFQVSAKAAQIAFERIQTAKRKASGEKRRPPAAVIDFLKEAQRKGYRVKSDISDVD